MSVKRKLQKKKKMQDLINNSVRIKCCYCNIKDSCSHRYSKEKSEQMGIKTFCSITPNKTKSSIKKKKRSYK